MQLRAIVPICLATVACNAADAGPEEHEVEVHIVVPESFVKTDDQGACASGCSLKSHPIPPFTVEQFTETLAAYAEAAPDQEGEALDTLLFYGSRTEELIGIYGSSPLPAEHAAFLGRELQRKFATLELRMIDEAGVTRATFGPERVPIGIKQHLRAEVKDVQPLEFNGTVMRVGLNYVWSRY